MKRTRIYTREYKLEPEGRSVFHPEDTINNELSALCFNIGDNNIKSKFFWGESGDFYISIQTSPFTNKNYEKKLTIESMPESANLPIGLTKLLNEKGFKKLD